MKQYFILIFSLSLFLEACSARLNRQPQQNPKVKAQSSIEDSFGVANNLPLSSEKGIYLVLKESALDKEFLLEGSKIAQEGALTSRNMQGRIVAFKKVLDQVYLLEATSGHVVTRELPSTRILAEFPILAERPSQTDPRGELIIDFNRGMRKAFSASGFHLSDRDGKLYQAQVLYQMSIDQILTSFIDSISIKNNILEIRQIAQVIDSSKTTTAHPFEFRYFLSPYQPNPSFKPKETSDFRRVGFFEITPFLEESTGRSVTLIQKWDHSRPIQFFISSNTPPEYRKAVQEGILYWNNAFGKELLQVDISPAGITAPDPTHNLVQWIDDQSANSIYADTLADPRTGEIRHAQIYISSSFAINSRRKAESLLKKLKLNSLSPLQISRLCDYDLTSFSSRAFQLDLENMLVSGVENDAFLRASQDYIRSSIAHEVGHTLGLRHNFAASLASTYTNAEKQKAFQDYLNMGVIPKSGTFASSVMDYLPLSEDILLAAQVFNNKSALPYDRMAIQWAYEDEEINENDSPYFCSDAQSDTHKDCRKFDRGPMPLVSNIEEIESIIEFLPSRALQIYLEALSKNNNRVRQPIEKIQIEVTDLIGDVISSTFLNQVSWLSSGDISSVIAEKPFPFLSQTIKQEIQDSRIAEVNRELTIIGSLERALFLMLPSEEKPDLSIAREASTTLQKLLKNPQIRSGVLSNNKYYLLSDQDIQIILKNSTKAFQAVELQMILKTLDAFKAVGKLSDDFPVGEIQKRLASAAKALLSAKLTGGQGAPFRYPKEIRIRSVQLLNETVYDELAGSLSTVE